MTNLQKDVAIYKLETVRNECNQLIKAIAASPFETPEYNIIDHDDELGFSITTNGVITKTHVAELDGDAIIIRSIEKDYA
jgi:hypothetical protein